MKILVTGCAGFVGSSLVDELLRQGHEVIGIDNFSTGKLKFIESAKLNSKFSLIIDDLLRTKLLTKYLENVELVYHLAANADIRGGLSKPTIDLEQNTIVTFNLLEAMRSAGVYRIVFASSAAALGEPSQFPTPEDCPIPQQTSLYGASKMACEGLISAYCQGYAFQGFAYRFVSLLGPRYPHGHVFDFVKHLIKEPDRLPILGDGNQRKSYLHINDCINAIIHISEKNIAASDVNRFNVYNLGYPAYCQVRDSAQWICQEMKLTPKFEFSGGDRGWVGDNPFVYLDVSKALSTGWQPTNRIENSVRETTRWLIENKWIFQDSNIS